MSEGTRRRRVSDGGRKITENFKKFALQLQQKKIFISFLSLFPKTHSFARSLSCRYLTFASRAFFIDFDIIIIMMSSRSPHIFLHVFCVPFPFFFIVLSSSEASEHFALLPQKCIPQKFFLLAVIHTVHVHNI